MFDSIGWPELFILALAGLFLLGPERLPESAAWLGRTIRQVKDYVTGAQQQIRSEIGPEFDELRKPLEELRGMRNFNPRTAVKNHLFDGQNPLDEPPIGNGHAKKGSNPATGAPPLRPLEPGERPPYDPDTT
ncbi:Sec-independent protein translocase subunit TatB [Saccharopolyspora sp. HNM0983]|uniref:Sec-independent protein translocase protein TatB n=1 Tax=Saccharopolyspora montiporae TaxID=2781240 RepID=A0A929BDU9_9PSEU|nr:Sec-independent protein translocase protein TatB [Saccharopolyspora sp. HNM0983]MBE9375687.1 Sec-independent protein translocase subunit TatB [Saccharopolyspora sp. HNM0983]